MNQDSKAGQVWWCMTVLPALGRLRQEYHKFKPSPHYIANSSLAWSAQQDLVSDRQTNKEKGSDGSYFVLSMAWDLPRSIHPSWLPFVLKVKIGKKGASQVLWSSPCLCAGRTTVFQRPLLSHGRSGGQGCGRELMSSLSLSQTQRQCDLQQSLSI